MMSDQIFTSIGYSLGSILIPFLIFFYGFAGIRKAVDAKAVGLTSFFLAWVAQSLLVSSLGEKSLWLIATAFASTVISVLATTVCLEATQTRSINTAIGPWWSYYWRIAIVYLALAYFSGAMTAVALAALGRSDLMPIVGAGTVLICSALATYVVFLRFARTQN